MSWQSYTDIVPSRITQTAFEAATWTFYGLASIMAIARTAFRVYTYRKIDLDDCFLILALLSLTGTVAIIQILYPALLAQNQVTLGQITAGPEFAAEMLQSMKLESAASNLTWITIYSVKYGYLLFFRNLLHRVRKMMIWWWVVFSVVTGCGIAGLVFHWTICPHFVPNFLEICPIPLIASREHTWLIVTTVTDIVSDAFIITVPAMILWNVKIPLRAKLGIGAALGLSLFMVIIAIIRISLGEIVPGVSDTIWIYFCWNIESSTAVFMISATAFRSTFGHHQNHKANKTKTTYSNALGSMPSRSNYRAVITGPSTFPSRPRSYESDDKTVYQLEVEQMSQKSRETV